MLAKPLILTKKNMKKMDNNIKDQKRFVTSQEIVYILMKKAKKNLNDVIVFLSNDVQDELHITEHNIKDPDTLWDIFNELTYFTKSGFSTDKWIGERSNGVFSVIDFVSKKKAFSIDQLKTWIENNMDFSGI